MPDKKCLERFAELESQIAHLKDAEGCADTDKWSEWATRVQSLLKTAFPNNPIYYEKFKEVHDYEDGWTCVPKGAGVFRAAKSDYESGPVVGVEGSNVSKQLSKPPCVFIGHGRRQLWARVQIFLEKDLQLKTVNYESEARAGKSIVPILNDMLDQATFAVLLLTAEDGTPDGKIRARQNVVHEAGLFQGRLGFDRAILLVQRDLDSFSNIDGLQHIPFIDDEIEQTFYELRKTLRREHQIK